jgi:hypothetical protein
MKIVITEEFVILIGVVNACQDGKEIYVNSEILSMDKY